MTEQPVVTTDVLARLAAEHLEPATAARWVALLRPAVRLVAADPGEPVIATLGGTATLPVGFEWPVWPGEGPLSLVAEVDLAALAATGLDPGVVLPVEGRLLASYRDDPDGGGTVVGAWELETLAGARLVHLTGPADGSLGPPAGVTSYPSVALTGRQAVTFPDREHPLLARFEEEVGVLRDDFDEALYDLLDETYGDHVGHQLGGWAMPIQGAVEHEVAQAALGGRADYDEVHTAEALRWRPVLQVDSDDGAMMWGDAGALYWLARIDATTPVRADEVSFTWQCG